MAVNISEALDVMRKVGPRFIRVNQMPGRAVNIGPYQIEVQQNGIWTPILEGLPADTAQSLVNQAITQPRLPQKGVIME